MNPLLEMWSHDFMRNAYLGSSGIAVAAGLAGYFLVLRRQVFAVDALSHVAFTGGVAALAFGFNELAGLVVATVGAALLLARLGGRWGAADDVDIGVLFALVLGLGALFIKIYVSGHATNNSQGGVGVLFGSIFGMSAPQAWLALGVGLVGSSATLVLARPLLFTSLDPPAAAAQGVGVGLVGAAFLVIVAGIASEAVQVTGALLILGLMATPAAIATALTARPYRAMFLSALVALAAVWLGLGLSYAIPALPPSFAMMALLFGAYLLTRGVRAVAGLARGDVLA
ncbi:MAG: metal ABC transporter permease [Candidatus Dormibacteria bacterium]